MLHDLALDYEVFVAAIDGDWLPPSRTEIRHASLRKLASEQAIDGAAELEIVLEPTFELSGRVVEEDGASFGGLIWAVPARSDYLLQKTALGFLPATLVGENGRFSIQGLPEGMYEIVVKRNSPRTYHRFDGFRAGDSGIELRIREDRVVSIRLRAEAATENLRLQPVLLKHQYRRLRSPSAPAPGCIPIASAEPGGVRAEVGTWSVEDSEGRTIQLVEEPRVARSHDFEPQQAGWYTVGLRAWDVEGRRLAPHFSEPFFLDDGDHEFVARLTR